MNARALNVRSQVDDEEFARWEALADDFDDAFYLQQNEDVRVAGIDPRLHYLQAGWREGRSPNNWFDGTYYLHANPDIAAADINPLLHFVWAGRREGRVAQRPHDGERRLIERARPAVDQAEHYPPAQDYEVLDEAVIFALLVDRSVNGVVFSFSHDNYLKNFGGVQRLIDDEASDFRRLGWSYLHLHPARPLPILASAESLDAFYFTLAIEREVIGHATARQIKSVVERLLGEGIALSFIVHHLMGHVPELLVDIFSACADADVHVWVHDFYTMCTNHNLLRNDWAFCHAPAVDSPGCGICAYGRERGAHQQRIADFFAAVKPTVLAPSEAALRVWRRHELSHRALHVVPMAELKLVDRTDPPDSNLPLRIAYVGQDIHSKGWTTYLQLLSRHGGDPELAFFHLGMRYNTQADPRLTHVSVRSDFLDREAMIHALVEQRIDIAVMWPSWPETFCYAAHEVLAAGAFILTHAHAGNIPALIQNHASGQGHVLDDENALHALFAHPSRLRRMIGGARRHGALVPAQNSSDLILKRHLAEMDGARFNHRRARHG